MKKKQINKFPKIFKTGDMVSITVGKDKGKSGKIKSVLKDVNKVIVENLNTVICLSKRKNAVPGTKKEMPIHVSNVMHIDPIQNVPTRVSIEKKADGTKALISKKSESVIRG